MNLMATNKLIERIVVNPFQPETLFLPSVALIISLLFINSKSFMNLLGSHIWITAEIALQRELIKKASSKTLIFYDTPKFYQDLEKAKAGYSKAVATTMMLISAICISLLSMVLLAGYLGQLDWRITIALLLIISVKGIAYKIQTDALQTLRNKQAGDLKKKQLLSSYMWTKETRTYGVAAHFLTKWSALNERLIKDKYSVENRNLLVSFFLDCIAFVCYATMMFLIVFTQLNDRDVAAMVSNIVTLFVAMDAIFTNINTVVIQLGRVLKNGSLSKDLFEFLSSDDSTAKLRQFDPDIAVHLKNVSFQYPMSEKEVLKEVSLKVHLGERIAIVGKNGSGKTTLVKLICGLYEPTKGSIHYGKLLQLSLSGYKNIATTFQNINTYCLSLAENVCISEIEKPLSNTKVEEILEELMGNHWLSTYPKGVKTMVGRIFGGIELSGGEKQRLSLARTFHKTSTILLLDEPTAAIDPLAEDKLCQDILRLSKDKTTFLVTHRLSTVRFADRIIVLDSGEIVEEGSFEALMAKNGFFAKMYSLQKQGLS